MHFGNNGNGSVSADGICPESHTTFAVFATVSIPNMPERLVLSPMTSKMDYSYTKFFVQVADIVDQFVFAHIHLISDSSIV